MPDTRTGHTPPGSWNSTQEMFVRLQELEAALGFILENSDGRRSRICAGYRDLVETQKKLTRALLAKIEGKD